MYSKNGPIESWDESIPLKKRRRILGKGVLKENLNKLFDTKASDRPTQIHSLEGMQVPKFLPDQKI